MRTTLKKLMPGNVFIHIHHLPKFKFGSLNKSDYLFFLGKRIMFTMLINFLIK